MFAFARSLQADKLLHKHSNNNAHEMKNNEIIERVCPHTTNQHSLGKQACAKIVLVLEQWCSLELTLPRQWECCTYPTT